MVAVTTPAPAAGALVPPRAAAAIAAVVTTVVTPVVPAPMMTMPTMAMLAVVYLVDPRVAVRNSGFCRLDRQRRGQCADWPEQPSRNAQPEQTRELERHAFLHARPWR